MLDAITPSKIELYINKDKKTIGQIKAEKGCQYIYLINGGIFDMKHFLPECHLKSNGVVYHTEDWTRWGLGWNNTDKTFTWSTDMSKFDNYIDCVELIKDGQLMEISCPDDMKYSCDRTAIGFNDGTILLYCSKDNDTPESLQNKLYYLGWKNALMLDGGGSSQSIDINGETITSDRIVYSLILVWTQIFRVQCGAFSQEPNALAMCNKIKALDDTIHAGYANAYVRNINGLYKVQIGAFSKRENSEAVKSDLIFKGFDAFITTE